jgi:hypothetical protein
MKQWVRVDGKPQLVWCKPSAEEIRAADEYRASIALEHARANQECKERQDAKRSRFPLTITHDKWEMKAETVASKSQTCAFSVIYSWRHATGPWHTIEELQKYESDDEYTNGFDFEKWEEDGIMVFVVSGEWSSFTEGATIRYDCNTQTMTPPLSELV